MSNNTVCLYKIVNGRLLVYSQPQISRSGHAHNFNHRLGMIKPRSDDLYMLSMHGNGCDVMERDYPAEAANQVL
jgi:hypothetical protein